jgi:hypothetical protein
VVWLIDRWPHLRATASHGVPATGCADRCHDLSFARQLRTGARPVSETDLRIVPFGIPTETVHQPHTKGKGRSTFLRWATTGIAIGRHWRKRCREADMDLLILSGGSRRARARTGQHSGSPGTHERGCAANTKRPMSSASRFAPISTPAARRSCRKRSLLASRWWRRTSAVSISIFLPGDCLCPTGTPWPCGKCCAT